MHKLTYQIDMSRFQSSLLLCENPSSDKVFPQEELGYDGDVPRYGQETPEQSLFPLSG